MARALGTDDAVTTCDCCGKTNLKFTVAMELDDGEVVHYGSTCAGRNTGKTRPQINGEMKAEAKRVRDAAVAEYRATPERAAYLAKLAARPRTLIGSAAFEFIVDESVADDAARARIAAKFGLRSFEIY